MGVPEIAQLVGTLGFPIVCCGALFWQNVKQSQQHKEEMDKYNAALNNNTLAITKLVDKLECEGLHVENRD